MQKKPERGGPRRLQTQTKTTETPTKSPVDEGDILRSVGCVNGEAERVLIDRFGHRHTRNVLQIWPDRVKVAMGLKFIDQAEFINAGGGRAHPR